MPNVHDPKRKPLVTVEFQTEVDLATGVREKRMFVKMYFEAIHSGLLAALPDELWKTLCALACYMDENGNCYPSQARIAKDLGVARETVNRRIQALLTFRFQEHPVLSLRKNRASQPGGSRWANNVYHLHPIAGLAIFNQRAPTSEAEKLHEDVANLYVTPTSHREGSVLVERHTQRRHTNQNQGVNQNVDVDVRETPHQKGTGTHGLVALADLLKEIPGRPSFTQPSLNPNRLDELTQLAADLLNDHKPVSLRTFRRIASSLGERTFRLVLDQANAAAKDGLIRGTKARYFMGVAKETARARGLDLGLQSQSARP
ncbi:MAG: helix-turn-helix domain-containing protein [Candidatus Binatia bacterium]